jgi:hypothetical protein
MGTGTLKRLPKGAGRAAVAACVAAGFVAAFSGPSCSSSDINSERPDGGPICQHGHDNLCGANSFCENGNCVAACPTGACPTGQYCMGDAGITDEVCAPNQPIVCTSVLDCPPPQDCLLNGGLCSAVEPLADGGLTLCDPTNSTPVGDGGTDDGCGPDAICLDIRTSNGDLIQCHGMPACGSGNECFHGPYGSTCNFRADGGRLLPMKQRLCLFGFCVVKGDCASGQFCVQDADGGPAGGCYSGFPGSPCNTAADCLNPAAGCTGAAPGKWGCCGPGPC